jgi:hypothetical protein
MKRSKSFFLPAIVVLVGVGAAFATHAAKASQLSEPGYYFDSSSEECIVKAMCSSTPGNTCTWTDASNVTHNLRRLSGTECPVQLSKP